jgi:predicted Zn-dependent protease
MGDDGAADRLYRAALTVKPDTPMTHFRLGNSLAKRSRFTEAIPHLRVMTEAFPDNAEAHFFLAQALHAGGFEKEGVAQAAEALRLADAAGNLALRHAILQRFAAELGPTTKDTPTPP